MDKNDPESKRAVSARERARRLGWKVDPPEDLDGGGDGGDPIGLPRQRPPRDKTTDGWGRR